VFEGIRQSLRDLMAGATTPDERRSAVAEMKRTLVQATLGVEDLRKGAVETRRRLEAERRELDTVRRRRQLAAGINDAETVAIAEKYERHHAERVAVLERKLEAQESEIALVEAEVEEMKVEFRRAAAGQVPPRTSAPGGVPPELDDLSGDAGLRDELDSLARQRRRASHDSLAEERLADLKRRMGK
jgi:hypothetical protein